MPTISPPPQSSINSQEFGQANLPSHSFSLWLTLRCFQYSVLPGAYSVLIKLFNPHPHPLFGEIAKSYILHSQGIPQVGRASNVSVDGLVLLHLYWFINLKTPPRSLKGQDMKYWGDTILVFCPLSSLAVALWNYGMLLIISRAAPHQSALQ